jgi:uncharacterized membrane protein
MEDAKGCSRILSLLTDLRWITCLHELCCYCTCTVYTPYITYLWDISFVIVPKHSSFTTSEAHVSSTSHVSCRGQGNTIRHSMNYVHICTRVHLFVFHCYTFTSIQGFYSLNIRLLSKNYIHILSTSCVVSCEVVLYLVTVPHFVGAPIQIM